MDCFGTYFTHVRKVLLWTWQPAHMEHTKYTAVRLLKTCTWQPAHMEHTKYTAVRTKVYIQQNHSACTDEALGRVYRWGPWPRVQTRPLALRPWPEPSACTCDPGPEPSACTCDPRKRVHRRPPDPCVGGWCGAGGRRAAPQAQQKPAALPEADKYERFRKFTIERKKPLLIIMTTVATFHPALQLSIWANHHWIGSSTKKLYQHRPQIAWTANGHCVSNRFKIYKFQSL